MIQNGGPQWVSFLSEFRNLNKQLKQKPYPITKINEMLLKFEGFQYATTLGGYYHIQLSSNASNLCKIILPWGKYWYKHLLMGVANFPDIFQHKLIDLFRGFEFICVCIDNLLVLTKKDCTYHLQKF